MKQVPPGRNDLSCRCSAHGHGEPEPIGLEYLGAMLTSEGFTVHFRSHIELTVSDCHDSLSIAMLSGTTCEYNLVHAAAEAAKARGSVTVIGGYHASGHSEDLLKGPFDHVVVGEGEEVTVSLAKVVLRGEAGNGRDAILGSGKIPRLIHARRIPDLDALPFPLRSQQRLGTYILYDLMWPPTSRQRNTAIVLASRGCRHSCDFCASSTVWGTGVRSRSPANIVKELHELKERFQTNTIVIIDQSFGQNKVWTVDVCRSIREAKLGMNWYHQSNLDLDRDLIREMADAGCTKIGFGLEGISPLAIERIKPRNPHELDAVNRLFDYCNSLGLFVKAYLMIGFPWETEEIVKEYFHWLPQLRANQIKISYLTPFPGTRDWNRYSGQLVTHDWADFDTVRMPVVQNPHFTVDQYHQIRRDLFQAFYGSPTYSEVTRQMLARFPHYVESYREFTTYLQAYEMITGTEPWLEWVGYDKHNSPPILVRTGD